MPQRVFRAFLILLLITGLAGRDGTAFADDATNEADVKPEENRVGEVKEIGLVITSVTKIDVIKENWEFEALLTIASKSRLKKCDVKGLDEFFPSGTVKKADESNEYSDNGREVRECKVTVEHTSDINVARYPFDQHDLEIEVGDEGDAIDGVVFKPMEGPDAIGLGHDVRLTGWELGPLTAKQLVTTDKHTKKPVTHVDFQLHARRPKVASFVKGFLAVCFQLLIALVALVLAVKNAPNRLGLATGALIAVATAHNQVSSQIGVSYLTSADKFFFLSYFLLLMNVIFTAVIIRASEKENDAVVQRTNRIAWYVLPALTLVGSALVLSGVL